MRSVRLPPPADLLGLIRLLAAGALPAALIYAHAAPALPPLLFALAAATDYVDGPIARRGRGPTSRGAILDNLADIAFVLAATGTGAALGLVPAAAPLAIALSFAAYATASLTGSAGQGTLRIARSSVGHAAGVLNYALAGLVAGAVALPGPAWGALLHGASLVVVGVNLAAVLARALPALLVRARVPRGARRLARSARS